MHEYMTRHMVALQSMPYAGFDYAPGDKFLATPDDAKYLERHKRARAVAVEELAHPSAPAFVAPVEVETVDAPIIRDESEDEPVMPAVKTTRRGRPSNASREAT